jgi:hypothetical protein
MFSSFSRPSSLKFSFIFLVFLVSNCDIVRPQSYGEDFLSRLHISGEAGVAFFDTGDNGQFPNDEFRVDEAKLFVEAKIINDIYIFGEFNVITREEGNELFELGELYAEFENIGGKENIFNVRFGRFDIPFGEEYLTRDAIDNPFVSHSLSDIWGVDEGVELYGFTKNVEYVFAVQNGGEPLIQDFDADKAIVGRFKYKFNANIHISLSTMRTGDIDVQQDEFSGIWFSNSELRTLGSEVSTSKFHAELIQLDGHWSWQSGHVHAGGGYLNYEDNDSAADNSRDVYYFQIEGVQNLNASQNIWYVGGRYSRIVADEGFPLVANGNMDRYMFDNTLLTKELWRFGVALGYRIGRNFLIKTEYNFERGKFLDDSTRDGEDFFGVEAAFKF